MSFWLFWGRVGSRLALAFLLASAVFASVSCGGGGAGANASAIQVSISPTTASVVPGGNATFTATVSGSSNQQVTWTASAGSITQAGAYTAPNTEGSYTVTATSAANTSVSSTAQVTVSNSSPTVSITLTPQTPTVGTGTQTQFTAAVTGTSDARVTWSASDGSISSSGLFTAPNKVEYVTITARSVPYNWVAASTTASVVSNSPYVTVTPASATVSPAGTAQFKATVVHETDQTVTWSATGGTIDSSGLFKAGTTAGTYQIKAVSVADPSLSATAAVTVNPITVTVQPSTVTVVTSQQQQFTAQVTGSTTTAVTWSASAGSIDKNGLFTAPASPTTVTITATSTVDSSYSGSATVTVVNPFEVFYDFNNGVPDVWSPAVGDTTPSGVKFLGRIGGSNTESLVLSGLTTHSSITVTFDLFVIGAWTGITGASPLTVTVGGTSGFSQTFSNVTGDNQSYPDGGSYAPGYESTGENTLGYTHDPAILFNDSTYHVTLNVAHTASTVTIVFASNLSGALSDMSWGLKNVDVKAVP